MDLADPDLERLSVADNQDRDSRLESVAAELSSLGVNIQRFPGQYRLYIDDGKTTHIAVTDDLVEILAIGQSMAERHAAMHELQAAHTFLESRKDSPPTGISRRAILRSVDSVVARRRPSYPLLCLRPAAIGDATRHFVRAFPGNVLYAVKCNPEPRVLRAVWAGGVRHFDCASLAEVALVRAMLPEAKTHFMHPVKARSEIRGAFHVHGVSDFALDSMDELAKILQETITAGDRPTLGLFVRLALPQGEAVPQPLNCPPLAALAAAQATEAAAREAALKAEQEARDMKFAERAAREATMEEERQAARDARYAARKARKRKGR